jgi:CubicO group peptidase (beta-lactamase class C family)
MKRLTLVCLLTVLILQSFAQKKTHGSDPFTGLDTAFARVLKNFHAAGFAIAVVKKDSIIYSKGFGYRDLEGKLPVTPHTLFAIGSCTKSFTASLIGQLDQDGRVNIDKPVRDYLPELRFYNDQMNNTITLRDMMCHRTGLSRYDLVWYLFGSGSRDSLIRKIQYMEPSAGIREKWQYNNFMFAAQGLLVEKMTNATWEENIRTRFFQPLGMNESNTSIKDLQKAADYSLGYGVKNDTGIRKLDYYEIKEMGPAGAINSNVTDMAAWLKIWIHGGKYYGKEIIPAGFVSQAISSQMVIAGALPGKEDPEEYFFNYGFGWMLSSYHGHYLVEHGGNIDGFSANVTFFPSDSLGIVVLSNQNGSQVPTIIRNIVADRLLHLPYKDWDSYIKDKLDKARDAMKKGAASKVSDRKPGTHPSHELNDYAGVYSNPAYGNFEVALERDSLFVHFPRQTWWLKHYHFDVFDPFEKDPKEGIDTSDTNGGGVRLQFLMDQAGDITGASMPLEAVTGKPTIFTRLPRIGLLSTDSLQKYIGEYTLAAMTTKVYVKNKALYLFVPGQPEYELAYVGSDKFSLKALKGFNIQFLLDDKGIVTAALAIQPNGTFKMQKK